MNPPPTALPARDHLSPSRLAEARAAVASIAGFTDLLACGGKDPSVRLECTEAIRRGLERLRACLDAECDTPSRESGKGRPTGLEPATTGTTTRCSAN